MARPKTKRFRLIGEIDVSSVLQGVFAHAHEAFRHGVWPDRPQPADRISDADWECLKRQAGLPDGSGAIDLRALLEHEIAHFRLALERELRMASVRTKQTQLRAIVEAEVGHALPENLHSDVIGLLAGMAWRDSRYGKGDWSALERCRKHVSTQTLVTPPMQDWAAWCLMLGVGHRSHERNHGGGHSFAAEVFISALINLWTDVLKRKPTSWVGGSREAISAAKLTRFVRICLELAGVRAWTAAPTKKIRMGATPSKGRQQKKLTLCDAHQRILRVRGEMRAAAAKSLHPNVLSRMLNR